MFCLRPCVCVCENLFMLAATHFSLCMHMFAHVWLSNNKWPCLNVLVADFINGDDEIYVEFVIFSFIYFATFHQSNTQELFAFHADIILLSLNCGNDYVCHIFFRTVPFFRGDLIDATRSSSFRSLIPMQAQSFRPGGSCQWKPSRLWSWAETWEWSEKIWNCSGPQLFSNITKSRHEIL